MTCDHFSRPEFDAGQRRRRDASLSEMIVGHASRGNCRQIGRSGMGTSKGLWPRLGASPPAPKVDGPDDGDERRRYIFSRSRRWWVGVLRGEHQMPLLSARRLLRPMAGSGRGARNLARISAPTPASSRSVALSRYRLSVAVNVAATGVMRWWMPQPKCGMNRREAP